MRLPEVSVVIPSYNHEKFITEAVTSVLGQTFGDIEVIAIDDGSVDGSFALLEDMARGDERLKVLRQDNAGSHATINRGVRLSSAPWIAILNSDDAWAVDRLEVMLAEAKRGGGDFLFSDTILVDGEGAPIDDEAFWWNASLARIRQRVVEYGVDDGLLYGNLTVSTSNFLLRREAFSKVGPFRNYRYNLDWDFVLRCLFAKDVNVQFVQQKLLQYRLHGKNTILGGMPVAAIEAQSIIRRICHAHFGVPQSLVLSQHRNDRLLRRYLSGRAKRLEVSYAELTADRDRLTSLLEERQGLIEVERKAATHRVESLTADILAIESSRNEFEALLTSRQAAIERERLEQELHRAQSYRRQVRTILERDMAACRTARVEGLAVLYQTAADRWKRHQLRGWRDRLIGILRPVESPLFPDPLRLKEVVRDCGQLRSVVRESELATNRTSRVAAHVHLYYKELAPELVGYLEHVSGLQKVVITGPWDLAALEASLEPLKAVCPDVRVEQVPNRGKDVGGLIRAIERHELLDSDYLLKIHSKKSHNPATYFAAISGLFGLHIENGDQWRRALIEPLAGSREQVSNILHWFDTDPTLGMVGAAPFVTSAPDANAALYQETCMKFGVPTGMPFVAGTMFWVRSSLLAPLLDGFVGLDDFEIDSHAVEGGLEHVMERLFGALVLARGFDLLKVES